ncbi:hypothetical protein [Polaromonas sp.]|uniref:hypothetical protein n=1 Tax=Polaromonas sp. TaxID=1869339 RepID=UPI001842F1DF|nr:hypothetical protein [Polaromonas sp.]NMM06258.1 hypothetical protein [Polaromonas sp.]
MAVPQRLIAVPMRVLAFKRGFMGVLVVAVIGGMGLRLLVLQHFMAMRVGVVFGQVQSDAHRHRRRKPGQGSSAVNTASAFSPASNPALWPANPGRVRRRSLPHF